MEEYAYRLTQELFKLGFKITVLCEKNDSHDYTGINVIELGLHSKPHWLSHLRFSQKVNLWLLKNSESKRIIHSHERGFTHNITTIHTTPFNQGKSWIFKFLSLRNFFYEKLEHRELFSPSVRAIVPVSNILGDLIKQKHPNCSSIIKPAIYPAVALQGSGSSRRREIPVDGGALGFIGKEWKRKGLPKAIRIWRELKKCRPNLKLKVAGVTKEMISHQLNSNDNGIEVVGFVKDKKSFYQSIDMLIHPAKLEAFGMVISEALAMGIPVLCSSECGASEVLDNASGCKLAEFRPVKDWAVAANKILENREFEISYDLQWRQVAKEYVDLYNRM